MDWQDHKNKHCFTTTEGFLARYWRESDGCIPLQPGTKVYLMCRMYMRYYFATAPDPDDTSDMSNWFTLHDDQIEKKCTREGPLKETNHAV